MKQRILVILLCITCSVVRANNPTPYAGDLFNDYNKFFATNFSDVAQVNQDSIQRTKAIYTAYRNCTPGNYKYLNLDKYPAEYVTVVIKGWNSDLCEESVEIDGKNTVSGSYSRQTAEFYTDHVAEENGNICFHPIALRTMKQADQVKCAQIAAANRKIVTPQELQIFTSHINDFVKISETRLVSDAINTVFAAKIYDVNARILDLYSGSKIAAISGNIIVALQAPVIDSVSRQFLTFINPAFKLNNERDAQAFQDVLDQLFPVFKKNLPCCRGVDKDIRAIERKDNKWIFVRQLDFNNYRPMGYILTTNSAGIITAISFSYTDVPELSNAVQVNPADTTAGSTHTLSNVAITPEEKKFFESHVMNFVKIQPLRIVSDAMKKVFACQFYTTSIVVLGSGTVAVIAIKGDELILMGLPDFSSTGTTDFDFHPFMSLLNPDFRLNTDSDAQALQDALDWVFPTSYQPVKEYKHSGNQWIFIRDQTFNSLRELIFTTNADGSIASVSDTSVPHSSN